MSQDQRIVVVGPASGIAAMAFMLWLLFHVLPARNDLRQPAARQRQADLAGLAGA